MTCDTIQPELIGYQFGTLEPGMRTRVEDHLLECPDCLRAFVALKRDVELAESGPAPSEASRQKLRRAMAAELGKATAPSWRWWERPLAFGFATAAVVVAVVTVFSVFNAPGARPSGMISPGSEGRRTHEPRRPVRAPDRSDPRGP